MTRDEGLRPRILRAVGAEALGQFLNVAIRLLLVPLFLSTWGAQAYGEWLILTAVAAWLSLGDLGGQLYFINRMTTAWAAGCRDEFQRVLSTGFLFLLVSFGVLLSSVVVGLMWLPLRSWLGLKVVEPDVVKMVLSIMALRFLVGLPVGLLLGVYRATGAQATSVMYGNLVLIIQFVGSAIALLAGAGMLVLAALEVFPLLMVAVGVSWHLRRRLPPDIKLFSLVQADRSILRESIFPSLHFLGIQLSMAIMIQGSVIAVAKSLGPIEVAIFSSMRTVSNVASRFLAMLSHSIWPELTRLHSTSQDRVLTNLFTSTLFVSVLAGLIYLLFVQNFGGEFYHWWLNHKLPYDQMTMFLMSCFVVLTTLWTFGGNLLMATNHHEEYSRLQLPVNVFALVLCYWGGSTYGLPGTVMGLILGQSICLLGIVIHILSRKGWKENSVNMLRMSVGVIVILPMCLHLWTGLASIVVVAAITARQFWFRKLSFRKLAGW